MWYQWFSNDNQHLSFTVITVHSHGSTAILSLAFQCRYYVWEATVQEACPTCMYEVLTPPHPCHSTIIPHLVLCNYISYVMLWAGYCFCMLPYWLFLSQKWSLWEYYGSSSLGTTTHCEFWPAQHFSSMLLYP